MLSPRAFLSDTLVNTAAIMVLTVMVLNGVLANWSEGLFALSYGPIYPGVHALSVLSVCAASFFTIYLTKSLATGALVGVSIISVHELVWASLSLVFYGFNQVAGDNYILIYLAITLVFLFVGRSQFSPMFIALFLSVSFYIFGVLFIVPHFGTANDTAAIAGWLASSAPFLVRR